MKKITATDPLARSADLVGDNLARLKSVLPSAFTDGTVDFDALRQLLGDAVDPREEKYGLSWNGKRDARQLALTPSTGTLRPCPEESVDWKATKNIFIEGDNLEVLKLLQKSYAGKVKLIYIDPPYNTGKDFVYPDNYRDNIRNYLELTGQVDAGGRVWSSNSEASGRFHTAWLNMIYPRLLLARDLLRDDGVMFITIDDTEVGHLRQVVDNIMGEENFLANVVWQKKYAIANDDPGIGVMHDHVLVYRKSAAFRRALLPRTAAQDSRYTNLDNDPRGRWASDNYVSNKSKEERPTMWYSIRHPKTGDAVWPEPHAVWRYSKEKHAALEAAGALYWGPGQSYAKPRLKRYLQDVQDGVVPSTWWTFDECGHNDEAQKETGELLENKVFNTPKPLRLIERMIAIAGGPSDSIVMDFFAGSGATGHAVLRSNISDGGARRYLLVQLPEVLSRESNDQRVAAEFCEKLGKPHSVAELTKERLRRGGAQIKESSGAALADVGFRAFKLADSNVRTWESRPEDLGDLLRRSVENVRPDRTEEDILFELVLKLGIELSTPVDTKKIAGKSVYAIGAGVLMACLASTVKHADVEPLALGIVAWHRALSPTGETTIVFRDSAFPDDVAKTNLTAILEQAGIQNVRSL